MRLFACLIVAPQWGYDEPAILSYAISSFCPTSADGLQCSGPSWKSARIRSYYRPCLGGLLGSSVLGCAGKTISPSLLFLSQTSVGKRTCRLHRVSPDCEHFVLIHAAWDAGFIGLISKLR